VRPVYPGARLDTGLIMPALKVPGEFARRLCDVATRSGRSRAGRFPMRGILFELAKDRFDRAIFGFRQKGRLLASLNSPIQPVDND
jgi:hypothetical protein